MTLRFAFSDKTNGNMSFRYDTTQTVIAHRRFFFASHGVQMENAVLMQVLHDDTVAYVDQDDASRGMYNGETAIEAEVLMTQTHGLVLCLLTADCFPVIYHDPITRALALAHLGRKPAMLGLAQKVVGAMHAHFGSNPPDIRVYAGPGIHASSYILTLSNETLPPEKWLPYVSEVGPNMFSVNLLGYILDELKNAGVAEAHIDISHTYDTATTITQFSHYRSSKHREPEGRFMTCSWMER